MIIKFNEIECIVSENIFMTFNGIGYFKIIPNNLSILEHDLYIIFVKFCAKEEYSSRNKFSNGRMKN